MGVIRKRPDAIEICKYTLKDDDNQWRQREIKKIQCISTFTKRFISHSIAHKHMLDYNSVQYRELEDIYSPYDNFNAVDKLYTQ